MLLAITVFWIIPLWYECKEIILTSSVFQFLFGRMAIILPCLFQLRYSDVSRNVQIEDTEVMTGLFYSKSAVSIETVILLFDLPDSPPKPLGE